MVAIFPIVPLVTLSKCFERTACEKSENPDKHALTGIELHQLFVLRTIMGQQWGHRSDCY